jgi:hypothetical protein
MQSATIYTFPARGRFAARERGQQLESNTLRVANGIVSSGSWYHEQAIKDEERVGTNIPPFRKS